LIWFCRKPRGVGADDDQGAQVQSGAFILFQQRVVSEGRREYMATGSHTTSIRDVEELDTLLSEPTEAVVRALAVLEGDIIILGVGGKMGPTLARMAKRASEAAGIRRKVIGVSRFSSQHGESQLQAWGVETIRCDLLDRASLSKLPEAPNVVYMAGMKFGSTGQESMTWAMNSFLPGLVAERYRHSRIAAFSTGNVYGLFPVSGRGARESDPLNPVGEYAMSCLGRERIFEHFSRAGMTNISILRLNYASEMRYGVILDIATRVYNGQTVPLSMGYLNAIWQGDASAMSLQALSFASTPPFVINIAGPELLSVRGVAEQFGALFQKPVRFEGVESDDALLSDAGKAFELFGRPQVSAAQLMSWTVDWVARGKATSAKPTHFENRAGRF
jgi:nucleoside-diphosphate-sugar epimerase